MTSTSETGHAKNYANFEELYSTCIAFRNSYVPTNPNLRLSGLGVKKNEASDALQLVRSSKTALNNATNAREMGFANLRQLTTRIVNALDVAGATKQTVQDAKVVQRKIGGKRASAAKPVENNALLSDPATVPRQVSVSQQSFDKMCDHFAQLIQVLVAEPLYIPNEADLKTAALTTHINWLRTLNNNVKTAHINATNARIARDKCFYIENTGLVAIASDVKKYIKSVFGGASPEFKQVSKLTFTRIKS